MEGKVMENINQKKMEEINLQIKEIKARQKLVKKIEATQVRISNYEKKLKEAQQELIILVEKFEKGEGEEQENE